MTDCDPRLVEFYDQDNPDGPDHDFYRALADEINATSVLDVGCGTGILTVTFARGKRRVVGVDPSAAMLGYARQRPGAEAVEWIQGDSRDIPTARFGYAVMTGNVAQHIPDREWERTLHDLREAMATGGVLAFESRNPARRAWQTWASAMPTTRATDHGPLTEWYETDETGPGTVKLVAHNRFDETGEIITESQFLEFRTRNVLDVQLGSAGFDVENVYGDWIRTPFTAESPIMVFVARAR